MNVKFSQADAMYLEQIYTLLNENLSFGLLKKSTLEQAINNGNIFISLKDDVVLAVLSFDKGDKFLIENNSEPKIVKFIQTINLDNVLYIKGITVLKEFRNRGIAENLLRNFMEIYQDFHFIGLGWEKPIGWEAERLFRKHNFRIVMKLTNLWNDLFCPYCKGNCKCNAFLIYK